MRTTEAANTSICACLDRTVIRAASKVRRGVQPVRVTNQALIPERELLPPDARDDRSLGAAEVDEALTKIERSH